MLPLRRFEEKCAELYNATKIRGGSMHIFDKSLRYFGGNAIVAGDLPLANTVVRGIVSAAFAHNFLAFTRLISAKFY
jgi:TPP-dependent pyruvate/acetoin dehydrogenase alpha subunit